MKPMFACWATPARLSAEERGGAGPRIDGARRASQSRPVHRIVPLLLALALPACADQGAERRAVLASLIGQSEAGVVQRLGLPSRTYEAGGAKVLAYDEGRIATPGGPLPGCEMTLAVAGGRVQSWTLRGSYCTAGNGDGWLAFGAQ